MAVFVRLWSIWTILMATSTGVGNGFRVSSRPTATNADSPLTRCFLVNSMLLNVTGVLFASQLATLMFLGPYADYGNWRPWIMIGTCRNTHIALRLSSF